VTSPAALEIVVALLLAASGVAAVLAAVGLLRLPDFFTRTHAPALASSAATWCATLASIVWFGSRAPGPALHLWLIPIVLSITAPVTAMMLSRAALFRGRQAGAPLPPPLGGRQ